MAEDNVVVAFQPLAKAIDDLIAEYGADRPDHQYQPLMLPMIDVKRIRAAIATQAHEPSADVVERSVSEEWCAYMDQAVSKAPEPLRQLGEYLAGLLDEDKWATAERYLNAAAIAAMRPESGEPTPAMVNRGVEFAIRAKLSGEYTWPDYIADLYRTMRKEPSHD